MITFLKHFRLYLLGHHFTLRTDHSSLQRIYSLKEPEGQRARWLEQIQEFDFEIVHRRGNCYKNADAFSRHHNLGESAFPGKVLEYLLQSCSCAVQVSNQLLNKIQKLHCRRRHWTCSHVCHLRKSPGGQLL